MQHKQSSESSSTFTINSGHQSFSDKQKSLFEELDNAERNNKRTYTTDDTMDYQDNIDRHRQRSVTKTYKRKESIFKRPEAPISRCLPVGRIPGFRKNPNKWTRYSLADVSDEDISDRGNMNAALSFLKELENRKEEADNEDEICETLPERVTFKKSAMIKDTKAEEEGEPVKTVTFRSSKVVMPEYVVGQKLKKDKKNMKTKMASANSKHLKLDHLLDEDEEA